MPDRIHTLLDFWFGDLGKADLPTSDRTNLWFGESESLKKMITETFSDLYTDATQGKLKDWENSARGRLGLIILYDQFSRYINRHSPGAFAFDAKAQEIALAGIQEEADHALTLIERVFFYMPLVHAEDSKLQEKSIQLFQSLVALSMQETTQVYQLFLAYAYAHFRVIKEFGRFPQRNKVLQRESTIAEINFLKQT